MCTHSIKFLFVSSEVLLLSVTGVSCSELHVYLFIVLLDRERGSCSDDQFCILKKCTYNCAINFVVVPGKSIVIVNIRVLVFRAFLEESIIYQALL